MGLLPWPPMFHSLHRRFIVVSLLAAGCSGDDGTGGGGEGGTTLEALPPLANAPLTTDERIVPRIVPDQVGYLNPRLPGDVKQLLSEGYGDYDLAAGEPVAPRMLDGSAAPPPGPGARVMTRFVHLADIQLADDESPSRVVNVDSPQGLTSGAFRPQEAHECRVLNAAVRTIQRLHEDTPFELLLLGGDNVDNAQDNEISWVLSILGGDDVVHCDSGADDDPRPGANNDPKDPFVPIGLPMPFVWVSGNHDILNQGNFPPGPKTEEYFGDFAAAGTRDWSEPGGPPIQGQIVADEKRRPLYGTDLLARVAAHDDGHGLAGADLSNGRAFYVHDIGDSGVRIIVMDTAAPSGSADGLIHRSELEDFLIPALDDAVSDGKLVIVTSHHASGKLTDGGGFGGMAQDDAITTDELRDTLASYPNLLMHLAGHTHHHRVTVIPSASGDTSYWEVLTSALADWPHQLKTVEIRDLDNGYYGIRMIAFDYATDGDPVAEEGRRLGILDFTSGWELDGTGDAEDRNVELYVRK